MSDDFIFDMKAKKVRTTDSQLLESLHEFAKQKDMNYFTTIDYDKWENKIIGSDTISERFGSWKKALLLIGVEGARGAIIKKCGKSKEGSVSFQWLLANN